MGLLQPRILNYNESFSEILKLKQPSINSGKGVDRKRDNHKSSPST